MAPLGKYLPTFRRNGAAFHLQGSRVSTRTITGLKKKVDTVAHTNELYFDGRATFQILRWLVAL